MSPRHPARMPLLLTALLSGYAHGADALSTEASFRLDQPAPAAAHDAGPTRYGLRGSHWGSFGAGVSQSFYSDATDVDLTYGYSYFMIDDVELRGELAAWYFAQDGDDAIGFNPAAVFRWHFWHPPDDSWTAFVETGIGALLTSDDVPTRGTSFNVTPRFGIGCTRLLSDGGMRLELGLRWSHISNARILGEDENPSRDGAMAYFAIIFPY